jgi:rhodanese-related sulfurtransferase
VKKYLCLFLLSILTYATHGLAQPKLPEVPRIDAKMAYFKYKAGQVILVDAMDQKTFAKKHILGSICLPNDGPVDIERIRNMNIPFPKDKEIIVYCE